MTLNGKTKILYIISSKGFSGAERVLLDLVSNIDKDKFDITIVCILKNEKLKEKFLDAGFSVIFLKKNIYSLYSFIASNNFDIIHTHLFGADVFGGITAKLAGVKSIISTEHNINIDEGKVKHFVKGIVLRKCFTKIIAVSNSVYLYVHNEYKIDEDKIVKIYNGIDLSKFSKTNIFCSDTINIGAIGRLTKQKGYDVLIRSLPYLNFNFNLSIAGDGDEKNNLLNLAKELKVDDKINFLGFVDNIDSFLENIDIVVIPSLWEGFGLVAVEALAAGKLVVASRIDGLIDIIKDNNGVLLNPGDYKDLADKLNYIVSNKEQYIEIANNGYNSSKNFDIKNTVNMYEQIYANIC